VTLPGSETDGGGIEVLESVAPPEFFLVDSMAPLDLAVLLWAPRLDVAMRIPSASTARAKAKGNSCALSHWSLRILKGNRQSSPNNAKLELW
jgi:hypothetical protein